MLTEWSIESACKAFTVRIEKPLAIVDQHSCPEPDVAWVARRSYFDRHPFPAEVRLLIEISNASVTFDRTEKRDLYAAAVLSCSGTANRRFARSTHCPFCLAASVHPPPGRRLA
ncbi:hypothetical protein UC8_20320 [Roseimaritima ulvae]|uniref:Putative restriction endonuclease domain-containing protein n=1 Tax=Roseimaritima ulvae TaxID=980254 RepID=A0A5B9QLW7_9BACT|nr:hypothetical protein UC8_20320 [Roseimaritima ulvae]